LKIASAHHILPKTASNTSPISRKLSDLRHWINSTRASAFSSSLFPELFLSKKMNIEETFFPAARHKKNQYCH